MSNKAIINNVADELRTLANRIEDANTSRTSNYGLLKSELADADRLLREAYRAGWFGADEIADFVDRVAKAEGNDEPGAFTSQLLARWAMIRLPGFSDDGCAVDLTRQNLAAMLRAVASYKAQEPSAADITTKSIVAARDAAIACIESSFTFGVNVTTYWMAFNRERSEAACQAFRDKIRGMVKMLDESEAAFDSAVTDDLITLIERQTQRREPVMVGKREFTTYHMGARAILNTLQLDIDLAEGDPDKLRASMKNWNLDPEQWTWAIRQEAAITMAAMSEIPPGKRDDMASGDSMCSPDMLATTFNLSEKKPALQKRLQRFRKNNHNGWIENVEAGPREPRFLYQLGAVKPIIDAMRPASSERPAKNNFAQ